MTRREEDLDRLDAALAELTEERVTADVVETWTASRNRKRTIRRTRHDPLLVDLARAVVPSGSQSDAGARSVPGSRPAANLDAIDRLEAIRASARLWCTRLDVPERPSLPDTLRALGGARGRMSDDAVAWLAIDASQWVTWAKTVTGWATPPFAPHVPCPACDATGGLRIHLERKVGCCLRCGADWRELRAGETDADWGNIYTLADHVRLGTSGESA